MTIPLVSVITATWQRHELLVRRCIRSVQAQDWPRIEHIIVSDGPDSDLGDRLDGFAGRLEFLADHDPLSRWGNRCRRHGLTVATGDLIAYLDDDDEWFPSHVKVLAEALAADPAAGFAYGRAVSLCGKNEVRIGDGPPAHGRIATGMIMHRAALHAAWPDGTNAPDWETVRQWLDAAVRYVSVDAVTHRHYPSEKTMPSGAIPVSFPPWRKTCVTA